MHDIFHVSLLEQNTTKKRRVDKKAMKLNAGNNEEHEIEAIWDSAIYAQKSESSHLPGLYYLLFWKGYSKKENTWELALAVQHLKKLISLFYKDHPNKPTATSEAINTAPPIIKPTVRPTVTK